MQKVLVVELSNGQMLEDVRLALNGKVPVEFYGRVGGNVPSVAELKQQVLERMAVAMRRTVAGFSGKGTTSVVPTWSKRNLGFSP